MRQLCTALVVTLARAVSGVAFAAPATYILHTPGVV